jgi:hypothetical protein
MEEEWKKLLDELELKWEKKPNLQSLLFLIGHRELGAFRSKFTKEQKLDLIHIAVCTLLKNEGLYSYIGRDEEGWPHYELNKSLPYISPTEQEKLLKKQIINYFKLLN